MELGPGSFSTSHLDSAELREFMAKKPRFKNVFFLHSSPVRWFSIKSHPEMQLPGSHGITLVGSAVPSCAVAMLWYIL